MQIKAEEVVSRRDAVTRRYDSAALRLCVRTDFFMHLCKSDFHLWQKDLSNFAKESIHESLRIECLDILGGFTEADEFHGDA
jgi:hypothetical protein